MIADDRPMVTLVRRLLEDGLKVSEVSEALKLTEDDIREMRYWHPDSSFTRAEAARYRDLLRYAAWNLPYWAAGSDGRLELLPEQLRVLRKMEKAATYRSRLEHGAIPPDLVDKPQAVEHP